MKKTSQQTKTANSQRFQSPARLDHDQNPLSQLPPRWPSGYRRPPPEREDPRVRIPLATGFFGVESYQ